MKYKILVLEVMEFEIEVIILTSDYDGDDESWE